MAAVHIARCLTGLMLLLSACKEEKAEKPTPSPSVASAMDQVRIATEANIRATGWPNMKFRGIHVWEQGMPAHVAVCGQLSPFAENPDSFVPFVSVVTVPIPGASPADYHFEHHIGSTTTEASHVYAALVDYCYEKGGPSPGPVHNVMATPPLPDSFPNPEVKTHIVLPPAVPLLTTASSGMVTIRQAANLHADPHGPSIRVIAQGTSMRVFGQAPGGWLQVGDNAPQGWLHESMTDKK